MDSFLETPDLADVQAVYGPSARLQSLSQMDVPQSLLEELALKTLYLMGPFSVLDLANKMHISFGVAEDLFFRMRAELQCQVTGMSNNVPQLAITSQGRARAVELLAHNHYVGPAPVSLDNYAAETRRQGVSDVEVHSADVERGFADLVLEKRTLDQLGAALNSGSSLFLYGPAGMGKTSIAEALSRVLAEDEVWIPYAVEVDRQIISVYDPAVHKCTDQPQLSVHDERWVRCRRPAVQVGGELTVEMLDLQFNPVSKYYVGPVQMKANNGVMIIDDFGRQRVRPEDLLNRWVVPLDRRIDFLTMVGGKKIEIPFEMLVVLASNLDPAEIMEPAFLRRIQTKIRIGEVTKEQFCEIFRRVALTRELEFDATIPMDLVDYIHLNLHEELRSCYPRDIVNQVCWAARYEGRKPYLDRSALMQAVKSYFVTKQ